MLKEVFASNAAKLVAACVCPVIGGAVALKVPPVRAALHKATAPKPQREARAKPRVRAPIKKAVEDEEDVPPLRAAMMCPQPIVLGNSALQPTSFALPDTSPKQIQLADENRGYIANCGPSRYMIGGMRIGVGMVPEPATWAQMVAGFGLLGAALRSGRCRARHANVTREA
jgi:hypothetical protein